MRSRFLRILTDIWFWIFAGFNVKKKFSRTSREEKIRSIIPENFIFLKKHWFFGQNGIFSILCLLVFWFYSSRLVLLKFFFTLKPANIQNQISVEIRRNRDLIFWKNPRFFKKISFFKKKNFRIFSSRLVFTEFFFTLKFFKIQKKKCVKILRNRDFYPLKSMWKKVNFEKKVRPYEIFFFNFFFIFSDCSIRKQWVFLPASSIFRIVLHYERA